MESVRLAYGADALPVKKGTIAMVQSLSGTGACRCVFGWVGMCVVGVVWRVCVCVLGGEGGGAERAERCWCPG